MIYDLTVSQIFCSNCLHLFIGQCEIKQHEVLTDMFRICVSWYDCPILLGKEAEQNLQD